MKAIKYAGFRILAVTLLFALATAAACGAVNAGSRAVADLRNDYETRHAEYVAELVRDADGERAKKALEELIAAGESYLGAIGEDLESEEREAAGKMREELASLREKAVAAGIKITPTVGADAKGYRALSGNGAAKGAGKGANGAAAGDAKGTFRSKMVNAITGAGAFIDRAARAVAGFFGSAARFVSDLSDRVFSESYDDKKISREIPGLESIQKKAPGFTIGVNFPWLPGGYGWDIGRHDEWGTKFDEKAVDASFAAMSKKGLRVVRWFLYCDGRANPKFDKEKGVFKMPAAEFSRDFDAVMRLANKHGIRLVWSFLDFHWFKKDAANYARYSMIARDAALQRNFIECAVMPVVERYADDPAIYAWEVINEPEWITSNVVAPGAPGQISVAELRALVKNVTAAIKGASKKPVTVGSANPKWMYLYAGTGIDMYQAHYYDKGSKISKKAFSAARFKRERKTGEAPVILGEFASKGSRYTIEQYVNMAVDAGYDGAWVWGYHSEDDATNRAAIEKAFK